MSKSKRMPDTEPASVPAYIVTFSDMITLLLTFFVLLISMAHNQDKAFFNKTRDAFLDHGGIGLGMLIGKRVAPELEQVKSRYSTSESDEEQVLRTLDAKEEIVRRKFQKLLPSMKALSSQLTAAEPDFSVTSIRFATGEAILDNAGKTFLTQFIGNLEANANPENVKLYVLGLAVDEKNEKEQLIVSSLRAQAVADYLKAAGLRCPVYSWGAGAGGQWVGRDSVASEQSQILIAILRTDSRESATPQGYP